MPITQTTYDNTIQHYENELMQVQDEIDILSVKAELIQKEIIQTKKAKTRYLRKLIPNQKSLN